MHIELNYMRVEFDQSVSRDKDGIAFRSAARYYINDSKHPHEVTRSQTDVVFRSPEAMLAWEDGVKGALACLHEILIGDSSAWIRRVKERIDIEAASDQQIALALLALPENGASEDIVAKIAFEFSDTFRWRDPLLAQRIRYLSGCPTAILMLLLEKAYPESASTSSLSLDARVAKVILGDGEDLFRHAEVAVAYARSRSWDDAEFCEKIVAACESCSEVCRLLYEKAGMDVPNWLITK